MNDLFSMLFVEEVPVYFFIFLVFLLLVACYSMLHEYLPLRHNSRPRETPKQGLHVRFSGAPL